MFFIKYIFILLKIKKVISNIILILILANKNIF